MEDKTDYVIYTSGNPDKKGMACVKFNNQLVIVDVSDKDIDLHNQEQFFHAVIDDVKAERFCYINGLPIDFLN